MQKLALGQLPRPSHWDTLGATLLWFPTVGVCIGIGWPAGTAFGALFGLVWGTLFVAPLAWRRSAPDAAAMALVVPHAIQLFSGLPQFGNISVPLMMYAVAAYGREEWRRPWLVFGLVASLLAGMSWVLGSPGQSSVNVGSAVAAIMMIAAACAGTVAGAWALGAVRRARLSEVAAQRERASAEWREQRQARELTLTTERQRIAREMHDIVAHSLSVIVIQADGAHYVAAEAPGSPEERLAAAAKAIETIQTTARAALADTRRMVGVLHSSESLEFSPAATLDGISGLVEGVRNAGRQASLTIVGSPEEHRALGATAELAAYRVVQEGLTNVLKHAGPAAAASVTLAHTVNGLTVIVRDDGPGATGSDGAGHGLIGMRERVSAVGGSLATRNVPSGGFEIVATFPTDPR